MSNRYVWEEHEVTRELSYSSGASWSPYYSANMIVARAGKGFYANSDGTLTLTDVGPIFLQNTTTSNVNTADWPYLAYTTTGNSVIAQADNQSYNNYWLPQTTNIQSFYTTTAQVTDGSGVTGIRSISAPGELIGYISLPESKKDSLPNDGISSNIWYIKLGSDSIDPVGITYSKEDLDAGDTFTATIQPTTPLYGGTIYYQWYYDRGSGFYKTGSTSTDLSKSFTIPVGVKSYQVAVIASDNWGFTSSTYVYGPEIKIVKPDLFVGIDNTARRVEKLYVGVNGVARQVKELYVGVNNTARLIFQDKS